MNAKKYGGDDRPVPQYVWVPCVPVQGLEVSRVTDANGKEFQVKAGTLCILGPTLGVRAQLLKSSNGLHRVRFADGQRAWVRLTSPYQWDDSPSSP